MPRYFFDVQGLRRERDEDGVECADLQEAVREAKNLLPLIAKDEVPQDGERHAITILVTDDDGHPVYSGALSYIGSWLIR